MQFSHNHFLMSCVIFVFLCFMHENLHILFIHFIRLLNFSFITAKVPMSTYPKKCTNRLKDRPANPTRQVSFADGNGRPLLTPEVEFKEDSRKCVSCGRGVERGKESSNDGKIEPPVENEILDKAKLMESLLLGLVQFTKGSGELKTTQDYFTQAEFYAEEANKFYKLLRQFTYLVSTFFTFTLFF